MKRKSLRGIQAFEPYYQWKEGKTAKLSITQISNIVEIAVNLYENEEYKEERESLGRIAVEVIKCLPK